MGAVDSQQRVAGVGTTVLIGLLVTAGLVAIVLMILVSMQLDGMGRRDQVRLAVAGDQRVLAAELAHAARALATEGAPAFARLTQARDRIDQTMSELNGDTGPGVVRVLRVPLKDSAARRVAEVLAAWTALRPQVDDLLAKQPLVLSIHAQAATIDAALARVRTLFEQFMSDWLPTGVPPGQIMLANQQLLLVWRMEGDVGTLLAAGGDAPLAADRLGRDTVLFGQVLGGLVDGDRSLGIEAITNENGRAVLRDIQAVFPELAEAIAALLAEAPALFDLPVATAAVAARSDALARASSALAADVREPAIDRVMLARLLSAAGVVTVLILAVLVGVLGVRARRQRREAEACQRDSQEAIERLLVPLDAMARGDLTVRAPIRGGATGHVAEAINAVAMAFRDRIVAIDRQAARAAVPLGEAQALAQQLVQSGDDQVQHVAAAERSMAEVAAEIDGLARQIGGSVAAARRVLELARSGAGVVGRVREAGEDLHQRMTMLAGKVEALEDRSREVDAVAELVYDMADQANILALNASIQAAQAGEAGRGFSVVAEEIQRLADRAGAAIKRMESVAQALQVETRALGTAVGQGAAVAGEGAAQATQAADIAKALEQGATALAEGVVGMGEQAQTQADGVSVLAAAMSTLRENTRHVAEVIEQAAASVAQLDGQLDGLRHSAGGFKLTF